MRDSKRPRCHAGHRQRGLYPDPKRGKEHWLEKAKSLGAKRPGSARHPDAREPLNNGETKPKMPAWTIFFATTISTIFLIFDPVHRWATGENFTCSF
jgi:hypothetical protein